MAESRWTVGLIVGLTSVMVVGLAVWVNSAAGAAAVPPSVLFQYSKSPVEAVIYLDDGMTPSESLAVSAICPTVRKKGVSLPVHYTFVAYAPTSGGGMTPDYGHATEGGTLKACPGLDLHESGTTL